MSSLWYGPSRVSHEALPLITTHMSSQPTASEASPSMNQLLEELSEINRRNLDGEVSDLSRKSKGRGSYGAVYTGKYKGVCGLLYFHVQVVR